VNVVLAVRDKNFRDYMQDTFEMYLLLSPIIQFDMKFCLKCDWSFPINFV